MQQQISFIRFASYLRARLRLDSHFENSRQQEFSKMMLTHFFLCCSLTFAQGSGFQRRLFMGNPEIENVFRAGKIKLKPMQILIEMSHCHSVPGWPQKNEFTQNDPKNDPNDSVVANANKPKLLRNANVKLFDNHGLKAALAEELADFLTGYTKDSYSGWARFLFLIFF